MDRARSIRHAIAACDDLKDAANRAFAATNWGGDNGCKRLLVVVGEDCDRLRPLLLAAQVLDEAAD